MKIIENIPKEFKFLTKINFWIMTLGFVAAVQSGDLTVIEAFMAWAGTFVGLDRINSAASKIGNATNNIVVNTEKVKESTNL